MNVKYTLLTEEKKAVGPVYKYKYYLLAFPIFLATILLLLINIGVEIEFHSHDLKLTWGKYENIQYVDLNEKSYFIKTEGCTIPGFDPFDPSVLKYHFPVKQVVCHKDTNPPLIDSNLTDISIAEKYLLNYKISDRTYLNCCYRPFYRPNEGDTSDNRHEYGVCVNFTNSTRINDEFIRVDCYYNETEIYKDFYSFVQPKAGTSVPEDRYNVLILGVDAVSRLNFYRTMPQTAQRLKNLEACDFRGYNKVGDNTYPNLIPLLTGFSANELSSVCAADKTTRFDDCPFIWKEYAKLGYLTGLAEDAAPIGVFNYVKNGFASTPTDYYWRTFDYLAESEIGHEKHLNAKLCIGPRLTVNVLLDYIYKFTKTLVDKLYFGFFWETSLTHDFLNYPLLGDESYSELIDTLIEEQLLNDTIVVLMSDHGIRWGAIRTTHQGRIEERLPFVFIVLPEKFKENHPIASSNMRKNTKRLTTPFDLHETFLDLLDPQRLTDDAIAERIKNTTYAESRGISLFMPIGEDRTCDTAGIAPHWCTCHQTKNISVDSDVAIKVADIIVASINNLLTDYVQCAKLNLTKIVEARIAEPSEHLDMKDVSHIVHDYTVVVGTNPGDGLFEATVRHAPTGWNVTGTISRLNLYGKQSHCVDNFHLKLYCFCDNVISKIFR